MDQRITSKLKKTLKINGCRFAVIRLKTHFPIAKRWNKWRWWWNYRKYWTKKEKIQKSWFRLSMQKSYTNEMLPAYVFIAVVVVIFIMHNFYGSIFFIRSFFSKFTFFFFFMELCVQCLKLTSTMNQFTFNCLFWIFFVCVKSEIFVLFCVLTFISELNFLLLLYCVNMLMNDKMNQELF